jgi:glycosyltransferase involved in cell wall biosynthesis
MISIELISRGEKTLNSVLDSIVSQNYKDVEIVCADASSDKEIKQLLLSYGCKVIDIPRDTGHLKARFIAHSNSSGDRSLILDSTRPLRENALDVLFREYYNIDTVILREDSLGNGFWVNQAKIIKDISESQVTRLEGETLAFLLPRFYNSAILTQAFADVQKNAGVLFDKISYGEHHLIFEACKKMTNKIQITKETLLSHYEDDSFIKIVRKYYRYGKMQKVLKDLPNSEVNNFSSHRRNSVSLKKRIQSSPLNSVRGISFILGYIL